MGVAFGLLAAVAFGTADYAAALSSRRIGVYSTLLCMQVVGFALLTVFLTATARRKLRGDKFDVSGQLVVSS